MAAEYTPTELEQRMRYSFQEKRLLRQALTHSSHANEQKIRETGNYERLEFLGDAVLELLASEFLFHHHPDMPEGKLTRLRSSLVCEPALAACARELELEKCIFLGKGEEACGGRERESIISDVMEALIGAIYLDGGMEAAKGFVRGFVLQDGKNGGLFQDSKTALQEMIQARPGRQLSYVLLEEKGPDHEKEFAVQAMLDGIPVGDGRGRTKKAAEQQAAAEAIRRLQQQGENSSCPETGQPLE